MESRSQVHGSGCAFRSDMFGSHDPSEWPFRTQSKLIIHVIFGCLPRFPIATVRAQALLSRSLKPDWAALYVDRFKMLLSISSIYEMTTVVERHCLLNKTREKLIPDSLLIIGKRCSIRDPRTVGHLGVCRMWGFTEFHKTSECARWLITSFVNVKISYESGLLFKSENWAQRNSAAYPLSTLGPTDQNRYTKTRWLRTTATG